jgi:ADP-ribosylation factor related protein 1
VHRIRYKGAQVIFWDLGGQSKMRAMWEKYYLEADAVVYVVDSANPARLDEAKRAFGEISRRPSQLYGIIPSYRIIFCSRRYA